MSSSTRLFISFPHSSLGFVMGKGQSSYKGVCDRGSCNKKYFFILRLTAS